MKLFDLTPQTEATSDVIQRPQFPESDLPFYRKFGRTDLTVSCLGLGGGGNIKSEDTLYAYEKGINFFFFSSDLHHYLYSSMSDALRKLCDRNSSEREKVVLATVTYIKNPEAAMSALFDQFIELRMDYIDIFFWGWIGTSDAVAFSNCLNVSRDLRGTNTVYQRTIEKMFGVSARLKKMGVVRYVGASFHDLDLAGQWLNSDLLDIVMVRHNVAHRTAQTKVFGKLDANNPERPGIMTFKSTGSHSGALWDAPPNLPQECWCPSVPDLYRYSLTQNCVDVCLTGMRSRSEIDAAITGVQKGKLTQKELDYMSIYGDLHRQRLNLQDIVPDRLIYR
jgi:predicted aldo/keto reductase-like oxidoreductase